MDIPALKENDHIGKVASSLAFIEKKQNKKQNNSKGYRSATAEAINLNVKEGQMAIQVFPNIRLIHKSEAVWLICEKEERIGVIFEQISRKKGLRVKLNPDKFVLLAIPD